MLNIAINIGSYSVKFFNFTTDRKKITYLSSREVVLDSDEYNIMEENIVLDLQMNIISQYLSEIDEEFKIILNISNELITERFLEIPIKNKKKAQLMLPFQLEEDIPFSLAQCHLSSTLEPSALGMKATVNLIKDEQFKPFYDKLLDYNIQASIATSEISAVENFVKTTTEILPPSFCILDIGHTTTNAYFFNDGQLKSTHTSYIAGYTVNEAISKNYDISLEESAIYKHQNCYFLSVDQYDQVNESQRVFATMMDEVFTPLTNEFKRWHVGYRVQNGVPIDEVFIIGGSSNIKNITNYLTEKIGLKVGLLQVFKDVVAEKIDTDEKQRRKFALTHMLANGYLNKSKLINILHGPYSIKGSDQLPLNSIAFVATRLAAICLIIVLSLTIERVYLSKSISSADKMISSIAKNPILGLSPRDKRNATKNPSAILAKLKRETKSIKQEVKTLQASVDTNAMSPLLLVSEMFSGLDTEIIQFQSVSAGDFVIVFKGKSKEVISQLDDVFMNSNIKNLFTDKDMEKLTFTVNGSED